MAVEKYSWWLALRHGGMLISPAVLEEVFPADYDKPNEYSIKYLRERYTKFDLWWQSQRRSETQLKPLHEWSEYILENFLKLTSGIWLKGSQISDEHTATTILNEKIKPNRLYYKNSGDALPLFAVFIDGNQRLGTGKGRNTYGRLLQYLRAKNLKLGVLINGAQIRLCYAGLDHESWVEWDTANWFESSEFLPQLYGFYTLLGPMGIEEREGHITPLIYAIESSRSRQGELSSVLGEQIRQAIELLVEEFNRTREKDSDFIKTIKNGPENLQVSDEDVLKAIFQSSVRIIMRMIVVLFAEARDLLPRNNGIYNSNYGLEGLFEILRHARSAESSEFMEDYNSGWLRLLGLFRLIYFGSPHPDIQIPRYGGELFAPGNLESHDPVSRALALFEDPRLEVSNSALLSILEKLKYGKLKIKKGRASTFVRGPVNFGELRTEYIGMIYEGILDYGLRSANETMLLINVGQQPILPLSILETLKDSELKEMFEKLSKSDNVEDKEDKSAEEAMPQEEPSRDEEFETTVVEDEVHAPTKGIQSDKAQKWAERAVVVLGLAKKPKKNEDPSVFETAKHNKARSLVKKIFNKDDLYLSLWGGTRKGTGTFYTKPQLSVPTVRRTLEPLVYEIDENGNRIPKLPEVILSIKVCDPSCGSGSFLVAATKYLTEALYESLVVHSKINDISDYLRKTLPLGLKVDAPPPDAILPCAPDEDGFEEKVKARLRRSVVEHCIYGVDLNPMAVELGRLSLWIETMDKDLPFEFLDHKLKVGNSLIGTWFDQFQEYPLAAWLREGGDKSHPTATNYDEGNWTKAIKDKFQNVVKPEIVRIIRQRHGELTFSFMGEFIQPKKTHKELLSAYLSLHDQSSSFFGLEKKEKIYIESILQNQHFIQLKSAMDLWCSIWFWPPDKLAEIPTPSSFYSPGVEALSIAKQVAQKERFFHWEIEFPDVFNSGRNGFDAILGNPPWDISKPNSKEFFSRMDPMYRNYGKQEALNKQKEYFKANGDIENEWLNYQADFKSAGNFLSNAFAPFGDPKDSADNKISLARGKENDWIISNWREQRKTHTGFASKQHPFRYQGSADLNLYKLFLEASYSLLKHNGRMGMIVPSGIYSDKGTRALRQLFLEDSKWEWLFGFENKEAIFEIHRSFKFNPLIVQKDGTTKVINTAFMRHNIAEWENPEDIIQYQIKSVKEFSPFYLSLLEIINQRDSQIIDKIYGNSALFGESNADGWQLTYSTELHSDMDSKYFRRGRDLIANGFQSDCYGRLIDQNKRLMLPLYQGVMIWQLDFCAKRYLSGAGNRAKWEDLPWDSKKIEPQYYIDADLYYKLAKVNKNLKLAFRDITASTNERTAIASLLSFYPCTDVLGIVQNQHLKSVEYGLLVSIFNSFVFDFVVRHKVAGSHIKLYILEELPFLKRTMLTNKHLNYIGFLGLTLNIPSLLMAPIWGKTKQEINLDKLHLYSAWALTLSERLRKRCIIEAAIAHLYGLDYGDLEWILQNNPSNPKGFWRVDKEKPVEFRQTTLTLKAFKRLKEIGLEEFLNEDWQLPENIQKTLGPRFYDWQLQGTPDENWAECEYHAKQILGEEGYRNFIDEHENPNKVELSKVKESEQNYSLPSKEDNSQLKLF